MTTNDYFKAAYLRYRGFPFSYVPGGFLFEDSDPLRQADVDSLSSEAKAVNDILRHVVLPLTKKKN